MIAFSRKRNTTNSSAYSATNSPSDVATSAVVSPGETASCVCSTFHTIHGCRPVSAVHQPAMIAISVSAT